MLKNEVSNDDLIIKKEELFQFIPEETKPYFLTANDDIYTMDYPVLKYPTKVKSLRLDKTPFIEGVLKGIKGQYLIFEDGSVFNVRNNEGFVVSLRIN